MGWPGVEVRPERVREARLAAGLTLEEVADGVVTRAFIHRVEKGMSRPSLVTLTLIADRTRKPIEYFLKDPSAPLPEPLAALAPGQARPVRRRLRPSRPGALRASRDQRVMLRPGSVRAARQEAGLSLRKLAWGIASHNTIFKFESGGVKRPRLQTLRLIAERTGKPLSYFLASEAAGPAGGAVER